MKSFLNPALKVSAMIFIFSLTINKPLAAQDKQPVCYIGITGGASFPLGNIKDNMKANRGGSISMLNFSYVFKSGFGITASWMGAYNEANFPWTVLKQGSLEVMPTKWTILYSGFGVGPMYSINLSKRFAIDLKVRAGKINTKERMENSSVYGTTEGFSFGYSLGTAVRYHIGSHWDLMIHADYISCKYASIVSPGRLAAINANGGFAYRF
jgi:hypothetical protein